MSPLAFSLAAHPALPHSTPRWTSPRCRRAQAAQNAARVVPRASTAPIRTCIERLQEGSDLGVEAGAVIEALVDGLAAGSVSDTQAGGLLTLLPPGRVSASALSSIAAMLRGRMRVAQLDGNLLDIVGTGGDGQNTVNISTAAAIVAASAGCRVAKSGNRSASSLSGSADVLEALGVSLGEGDDALLVHCMDAANIAFLFARNHHPALAAVASVRKALAVRTVFNVLGPLVHPVPARHVVLGVYSPKLVEPMARALANLGTERALVVHCAGLDELCPAADAVTMSVRSGHVVGGVQSLSTTVGGIRRSTVEDLVGGDAAQNAEAIRDVFMGKQGPVTDAILLNAGAGCMVYGLVDTLEEGVQRARSAIETGAALNTLQKWVEASTNKRVLTK
eukprot:IDg12235t1